MPYQAQRHAGGVWWPAEIADAYYTPHHPACAFLVLNGPSLADSDRDLLSQQGILTAGVNNGAAHFRPHFWFSVDHPARFLSSVWLDPTIAKFVGDGKHGTHIRDEDKWNAAGNPQVGDFSTDGTPAHEINRQVAEANPNKDKKWIKGVAEAKVREWHEQYFSDITVGDCPNVIFCKLSTTFRPSEYLTESVFCMGNSKDNGGGRSVMLFAIKTLYVLGFRRVYLVGCDWFMDQGFAYGFKENRHQGAVNNNNTTFGRITSMLVQSQDHFRAHEFEVHNCNENSFLTCMPFTPLDEAVEYARRWMPQTGEVTHGRYGFKL